MSTARTVVIEPALHRELKLAAAISDEDMKVITARGVAAEVRRVMKRHSSALQSEDRSGSPAGAVDLSGAITPASTSASTPPPSSEPAPKGDANVSSVK